jgi:peptidoglycan hydrolase CwlO-like protein
MPRTRNGRVGRSTGVAEHRLGKLRRVSRLSRTTPLTRASALACVLALALAGAPNAVSAQTATESIARTRAAIDTAANQWFAGQRKVADLDLEIQTLTKTMATTQIRVDKLRTVAGARAVELYESNTQALGVMSDTQMGGDPLELGRRAALIGQANTEGQAVIDQLEASIADLNARRAELHAARSAQTQTLRFLTRQRRALDTLLASLELGSAHAEARAELAAALRRHQDEALAQAATRPTVVALTAVSPATPTPAPASSPVVAPTPAPPSGSGGVSSVHDEPFLVCTRARESDGNYSVVSSGGTYYGAYQFATTTWNVTASHLGRLDLVGVLPSRASAADQDEMAWALYQWQGNAPWGGRC